MYWIQNYCSKFPYLPVVPAVLLRTGTSSMQWLFLSETSRDLTEQVKASSKLCSFEWRLGQEKLWWLKLWWVSAVFVKVNTEELRNILLESACRGSHYFLSCFGNLVLKAEQRRKMLEWVLGWELPCFGKAETSQCLHPSLELTGWGAHQPCSFYSCQSAVFWKNGHLCNTLHFLLSLRPASSVFITNA